MQVGQRQLAYAILRLTLGFVFLVYAVEKLMTGPLQFSESLQKDFSKVWLPPAGVYIFGLVLPFLELVIGLLLILGLFTKFALILAGGLLVVLTIGLATLGNPGGVAHNLIFSIIIFLLLYHAEENGLCLDRIERK